MLLCLPLCVCVPYSYGMFVQASTYTSVCFVLAFVSMCMYVYKFACRYVYVFLCELGSV